MGDLILLVAASESVEADSVLRQMILAIGGLSMGLALVMGIWYVRERRPYRSMVFGIMVSYTLLGGLTTQHVYAHLSTDSAPAWQLWTALVAFGFGVWTLATLVGSRATISPRDSEQ